MYNKVRTDSSER